MYYNLPTLSFYFIDSRNPTYNIEYIKAAFTGKKYTMESIIGGESIAVWTANGLNIKSIDPDLTGDELFPLMPNPWLLRIHARVYTIYRNHTEKEEEKLLYFYLDQVLRPIQNSWKSFEKWYLYLEL